ncbi:hypothetical protein G9A89_019173 [Geosiphon pyriformis]|nr:hypothetical protein G9A89_019173 [Geosiphon pyriformis]
MEHLFQSTLKPREDQTQASIEVSATTTLDSSFIDGEEKSIKAVSLNIQDGMDLNSEVTSMSGSLDSVSLTWQNLSYTITNSKTKEKQNIIEGVSGIVKPGEVMAIMGPSGAGKSTLLDLLAGRKDPKAVSGQILLNGRPGEVKYVSTYVMQDDALMGVLTVRENIQFAADLCFPSSYTPQERRVRVQGIIQEFGLDRVADSKIGTVFVRGVSGGEKRRASIASQVITLPKIIFLDEPTTGLDSAASYNVMKAIVSMARRYKLTVIASIHQPSTETYSLFDSLFLIGRGRTLYTGTREGAIQHFEKLGHVCPPYSNPADHFISLVNSDFMTDKAEAQEYITKFITAFEQSEASKELTENIKELIEYHKLDEDTRRISGDTTKRYSRNFFQQTRILLSRSFKNAIRNILLFWVRLAMYVGLGLLIGTTWWKIGSDQERLTERLTSEYFSIAFLSFMSVAGVPGFLEERNVFQRERANGFYSVGSYALANSLVSIPFLLIIATAYTIVVYPTVGYHSGFEHAVLYAIYMWLCLLVAEALVVFIAAIIPIFVASLAITAFTNGFFMVMAGYLVKPDNIPQGWKWAHYICYQKYAFEAMIENDIANLTFNCEKLPESYGNNRYSCNYGNKDGFASTFTGRQVLDESGYSETKQWAWILVLIAMIIFYRFAFYLALRIRKVRI